MKVKMSMAIFAALVLAACASTPKTAVSDAPATSAQGEAATNEQTTATAETGSLATADLEPTRLAAQLQELRKNAIYFDFAEFAIKPEFSGLIRKQAEFIKSHGNAVVTLAGNADERGSSEFNLALGDRRANAVLSALKIMGASGDQIKIVSYGEERPSLDCHEEQCWKENRRVDFIGKIVP